MAATLSALPAARLSFISLRGAIGAIARTEPAPFAMVAFISVWGVTLPAGQALVVLGAAGLPWWIRGDPAWQYHTRFHGCSASSLLRMQAALPAGVAALAVGLGRMRVGDGVLIALGLLVNVWLASIVRYELPAAAPGMVLRRRRFPLLSPVHVSILREKWVSLLVLPVCSMALSHLPIVVVVVLVSQVLVLTKALLTRPVDALLDAANSAGRRDLTWYEVGVALAVLAGLTLPLMVLGALRSPEIAAPLAMVTLWALSCTILAVLFARQPASRISTELAHLIIILLSVVPPIAAWLGARLWLGARAARQA